MSTPLFFPLPTVVLAVDARSACTLRELLASAGAPCRASGRWTERRVVVEAGYDGLEKEAGDWGAVRVGVPQQLSPRARAQYAASVMAYALMDGVARESIRGLEWAKPAAPRGRPRTGQAKTGAERQRARRAKLCAT